MANVSNIITAAVGSILISTAFVSAAVAPATTAGKAPTSYALASVSASTQTSQA